MTEIIWCQTCKRYYPKSDSVCPYCEIEHLTAEVKKWHQKAVLREEEAQSQWERAEAAESRIKELEAKLQNEPL